MTQVSESIGRRIGINTGLPISAVALAQRQKSGDDQRRHNPAGSGPAGSDQCVMTVVEALSSATGGAGGGVGTPSTPALSGSGVRSSASSSARPIPFLRLGSLLLF